MSSPTVDQARIDANWRMIAAEIDAPRPSLPERLLGWLRVPGRISRLIVATPALRRAWYVSVAIAVIVGLGAAQPDDRSSLFALLILAPALPVLGVALAYGPAADPMYEAQLATPMRGIRLVAIRALTVLAVAAVAVGVPALLSPPARPVAFLWLLPALALTSASLGLMTWLPPRRSATVIGVAWFVIVSVVQAAAGGALPAFGAIGQLVSLAVAVVGAAVAFGRRAAFDRMELVA
jgi:hypothetical protein